MAERGPLAHEKVQECAEVDKENAAPRLNAPPARAPAFSGRVGAITGKCAPLEQTPPIKGLGARLGLKVEVRDTFIHCMLESPASPSSAVVQESPKGWTEPRNARPNLGQPGTPYASEARAESMAATPSTPATGVRTPSIGYSPVVTATPSSCGSAVFREAAPCLVPAVSLYAGLQGVQLLSSSEEPPKQLKLSDLLTSPAKPLRLSDLLPPPSTAASQSARSSSTATPSPSEVTSAPTAGPPSRLPRMPESGAPSLLEALFGSPGSRNGGQGAPAFGTDFGADAARKDMDKDDDFQPRRLSFAQA